MPYCVVADLLTEWFFFESVPFFLRKGIPMPQFRSVLAACIASAAIGGMVACSGKAGTASPPNASTPDNRTAAASDTQPGFAVLKGRWLRPDGGYVVEVKSVDASGKMDASYANPRRINVSKAEASRDGPAIKVFIELRDANYPGSTYNLTYDPQSDQLQGIYYQAALQQQFEVVFVRME